MKETNYVIDNKKVSYEVLEDGYKIYLDGTAWIHQYEPYIPYPELFYEENAIKQIEEICSANEEAQKAQQEEADLKQQVTDLELAMTEMYEMMLGGTE